MTHRLTILMEYSTWAIKHGAAWLLMLLAAAGLGRLALRRLRFHSRVEGLVFTLATGLGLCALGLFGLGLVGLLNRPVIWGLTLASALISLWRIARSAKEYRDAALDSWRNSRWLERCLFFGVTGLGVAYGGVLLLLAQYPPLQWDAIASHLVLAREYLEGHRVVPLRTVPHPILPALNHMLFTWALALFDDILAQMVEYTFMTLTALGLIAWGRRMERSLLGFAAATLWLSHPAVLWLAGSAYIDLGLTCFAFLGVYAMRVFWDKRDANWWKLGLALFAMSAGVKLPGLFFVGLGAGIGLWAWMRSGIGGRALAQGVGIAAAIGLPWFAFITFHTGNPFWPLVPQLSRGSWVPTNSSEDINKFLSYGGTQKTFWNFLQTPVHLITRANLFVPDNQRGLAPAIALLPLAWIIALWHRSTRWWAMWLLAYTAFWYYNASFMRYWLPVAPLAGLALFEGLQWVLDRITKSVNAQRAIWVSDRAGVALTSFSDRRIRAQFRR